MIYAILTDNHLRPQNRVSCDSCNGGSQPPPQSSCLPCSLAFSHNPCTFWVYLQLYNLSDLPIELSGDERTLGHVVPVVESVARQSVMLPAAKDIIGDGVEITTGVLVAIIVVVVAGEAVALVAVCGGRVVVAGCRRARCSGSK